MDDTSAASCILTRGRRVWIILASLSIVLATPLLAHQPDVQLGSQVDGPTYQFPATGFGGYQWNGAVHDLKAQWRVPEISATSPTGVAATWIGAQVSTGNDFIQIGVDEITEENRHNNYVAFWSDSAVNFHPQPMGLVSPGELIFVSMNQNADGWLVAIYNRTKSFAQFREIHYEARVHFTTAAWIQEDPAPGVVSSRDTPYPVMTNVEFQNLKINGVNPRLNLADGLVLIASTGEIRVPTAVRNDSFTFTAPYGAQRQYLEDARTLDIGVAKFQADFVNWKTTPTAARSLDVKDFVNVLRTNVKDLQRQAWPGSTQASISKLIQVTNRQIAELQAWSRAGLQTNDSAFLKYVPVVGLHQKIVNTVRASLKLPPI